MTEVVAAGYDAVYRAWASSRTFHDVWATYAVDGQVAVGFEHLNFAGVPELRRMGALLDLRADEQVVDLACGAGGPGVWIAQQPKATLFGVDLSRVGARLATQRAKEQDLSGAAFVVGSVERLPLADACAVAVMSVDSLQYVTDKRATFAEVARILHPRGAFVFTAFEVDADRVREVPVLGADPVQDYSTLLRELGFTVETYEETPGWKGRLVAAYSAVVAAEPILRSEMGSEAMDALLLEMLLTLEIEPYRRRVLVAARSA